MNLSDALFSNFLSIFKQKGFNDLSIIKNWKKLKLPHNIKNEDLIPFKITDKTLYLRTQNQELFSEFNFIKNDLEEVIFSTFGTKEFNKIKVLAVR